MKMKTLLAALLVAAIASPAMAQTVADVSLNIESVIRDPDYLGTATVKVTNQGTTLFEMVIVTCGFLDSQGSAISTGKEMIWNLAPGKTAYGNVKFDNQKRVQAARCRVEWVH
jgi:uncharacterized cupredoxin-like copper-binding protein